jgi:hypothetical protein
MVCNYIGPIDYGTTNMFVKATVKRARDAHERARGMLPYQEVICVLADRVEALEKELEARIAAPNTKLQE